MTGHEPTPSSLPIVGLSARIAAVMKIDPSADALRYEGVWWSWSDLASVGAFVVTEARSPTNSPPACVAVLLRNSPAVAAAVLGLVCAGQPFSCISPLTPDGALVDTLAAVGADVLIADSCDEHRLGAVGVAAAGLRVVLAPHHSSVPVAPPPLAADADDMTIEILTSGTTGTPKRVHLALSNIALAAAAAEAHHGGVPSAPALRSGAVVIDLPLYHIAAMGSLMSTVAVGRRVLLFDRFDVTSWAAAVREFRLKAASLVPSAMRMVLDADVPAEELSSLRVVRAGTAPLDLATQDEFEQRYGVIVIRAYGATEFAGGVASMTYDDRKRFGDSKRGSVGRPHPGVVVKVVDPATGVEVPFGRSGTLMIRGEQLDASTEWIATSDLARVDEDGFLWIDGRADDVIIRGGFKVAPAQVESALRAHPLVRDAIVLALPDRRLGQVPVAAVELTTGDPTSLSAEELRAWARERLTPYLVPVEIAVVHQLPRNATHKVRRDEVLAMFSTD